MTTAQLYQLYLQHPQVITDTRSLPPAPSEGGGEAPAQGNGSGVNDGEGRGGIFLALKGASFDGNRFAATALERGCSYAVVDEPEYAVAGDPRYILVDDCLVAYKELAREHRRHFSIPVVGITGTNGKTTTKELISAVLAEKYRVMHTEGNFNNDVGVPRTLLRLTDKDEIAVVEMGASHPGDIRKLVEYVEPTCGLITNVGRAHLQGFGSFEGVMRTKGELYDFLQAHGGLVFLNTANPHLTRMARERHISHIASYGTDPRADVVGRVVEASPFVKMEWWQSRDEGVRCEVQSQLIGTYNLDNMLAAVAVGLHFGVTPLQICHALAHYKPSNNRSELERTADNVLIVDAYNANPTSMAAAIDSFLRISLPEPKMAILGDMRELGAASAEEHQHVVDLLREKGLTDVWLVGPEFGKTRTAFRKFADVGAVRAAIAQAKPRGRCILIKGSNGIRLFELPAAL